MKNLTRIASVTLVSLSLWGLPLLSSQAADMMAVSLVQPDGSRRMMKLNLDQPVSELRALLVNRGLDITPHDKIFSEEMGELSPRDEGGWIIREVLSGNILMFKPRGEIPSRTPDRMASGSGQPSAETITPAPAPYAKQGMAGEKGSAQTTLGRIPREGRGLEPGKVGPQRPLPLPPTAPGRREGGEQLARDREEEAPLPSQGYRQEDLLESVRHAVGADYNWPGRVKKALEPLAASIPDPAIRSKAENTVKHIKQPEDLLFFAPHEDKTVLYRARLTPESGVFQTFKLLFKELDALSSQLEKITGADDIRENLEQLKRFYERFIAHLCASDPEQKEQLLEQKALLYLENPLDSYRISQETARQLISKDRYGFTDKRNATGMRAVRSRDGVHFKLLDNALDDPRPGMEFLAYAFANALTPQFLATPTALIKLESVSLFDTAENFPAELNLAKIQGKSLDEALAEVNLTYEGGWQERLKPGQCNFFLQASRTIGQQDFAQTLKANPHFEGDPVNLSWQFLFALLTNPGDGKADNYSVDGQAVIGIDNDKIFCPALYRNSGDLSTGINCILYLLDSLMDAPLHPEVRKQFLSLDPSLVVLQWLANLQGKNALYEALERQGILSPRDLETLGLPIRLSLALPEQIREQIAFLQRRLKEEPSLTSHQLLRALYPVPADYYRALRERYKGDPLASMWVIYKGRDEGNTPQKVNHVLNLSPEDANWQEAQRNEVNPLEDDLIACVKQFMQGLPPDSLLGSPHEILSLVLSHFPGHEQEFFPGFLPEGLWQGVVRGQGEKQIYDKAVLDFLMRRAPKGLNRVDARNRTPLDVAFDYLHAPGQNVIVELVNRGASQLSFSGRLYRSLKKSPNISSTFWDAIGRLQQRNAKMQWLATLEEAFPLATGKDTGARVIRGASGETRLLTDDILKQLENPKNAIRDGRRQVVRLERDGHVAFVKFAPELVGFEDVIGDLTRTTIGFGAPYGELFRFPNGEPAWVSQGIPGDTLQWVLANDPKRLEKLDPVSTFNMILMAMLVNPEDGKPDNYIVEPLPDNPNRYRLSCPDNDHGFVPAFVRAAPDHGNLFRKGEAVVQVKTILYCLDQMRQPIPEETRALFLKGSPVEVVRQWLTRAIHTAERYQSLYTGPELFKLFKEKGCFVGIPFQKGMVAHIYGKWVRLQEFLQDADLKEEGLTPLELLSKLEPRLASRYQAAFVGNAPLWDRFKKIDGVFYHESGKTLTLSGNILTSHNIPLQESVVQSIQQGKSLGPQQAMEELTAIARQLGDETVVFQEMATDLQRESYLKRLDFAERSLNNQNALLDQIGPYAPGLRALFLKNCSAIDNSRLLKQFFVGQLVDVNLQGCQNVTHDIMKTLAQEMPGLERLNLSNLPKLKRVARRANRSDPLVFQGLSHLNLNDCAALKTIDIEAPKLRRLWVDHDKKLKVFKVEAQTLQALSCEGTLLTKEMLSILLSLPGLKHLSFENCPNLDDDDIPERLLPPLPSDEEIYERFLKGVLIYKPNKDSDEGRVDLPIAALDNSLEGTFDLSGCGDTGKYLSISTGYRKGKKPENEDKVEIWIAPKFLIKKDMHPTAGHFEPIMESWKRKAEVGLFWTWGNWDDMGSYDYLTTENMDNLSKLDLYENWEERARRGLGTGYLWDCLRPPRADGSTFRVSFLN